MSFFLLRDRARLKKHPVALSVFDTCGSYAKGTSLVLGSLVIQPVGNPHPKDASSVEHWSGLTVTHHGKEEDVM